MNERKFLPDIPLLPEEREIAIKSGKPKLPGAPSEAHESILLSIEEGLPLLDKVGGDLKSYAGITKSEKKKDFKYAKIHSFLNNPKELEAYFDTLRILGENWEGRQAEVQAYQKDLLDNLEKFIDVGTLTPVAFEGWISLMVKSEIYRPLAERVIKSVLEKSKNPQSLTSFLYNLTEGLLATNDKEVLEKGLEVLTLGAPFLDQISEHFIMEYMKAVFTTNDDETLRRVIEIDTVIHFLGPQYADSFFEKMQHRTTLAVKFQEYKDFLDETASRDPQKLRALNEFFSIGKRQGTTLQEISTATLKKWPYSLVAKGGRVRDLFNERVTEGNDSIVTLALPSRGNILHSLDTLVADIIEELNQPVQGSNELKDFKYLKTLFYLCPKISKEKREELSNDVALLRQEIYHEKTHGISPRGDKMLIGDKEVSALGIKSFTFKVEEYAPATTVLVEAGNYNFVLTIDSNFEIKDAKGNNLPLSFEQRAYMEHLILSYLKELMCTDRTKPGNGVSNGNGAHQTEREQEFKDRRPHLRKMAPNNAYSQEALAEGLADPINRWDLARINAELGLTKLTGQKTYVKVVHKSLPGEKPLESRAPHATDRIKKILTEVISEKKE